MEEVLPSEQVQTRIRVLRGQRVILDSDLAALYGVATKRLNEQVRRNIRKFPEDFCFQLTPTEAKDLFLQSLPSNRSQIATGFTKHRDPRFTPFAFTEYGALQAANVLKSERATTMSVEIVRAFVRLRQLFATHKALSAKLNELDERVGEHDKHLASLIEAIRLLTSPDAPEHGRKIGFHSN